MLKGIDKAYYNRRYYLENTCKNKYEEKAYYEQIESRRVGDTRIEYAEFLMRYYWEDMITVTFKKPRKEPYYAAKAVWNTLRDFNATKAFLGVEPHQSGDLHIHGLVSGNIRGWKPELKLPWDIWHGLYYGYTKGNGVKMPGHGRSTVSLCNSPEKVTMYCAKYILKQQDRVCDYYYIYGDKFAWDDALMN